MVSTKLLIMGKFRLLTVSDLLNGLQNVGKTLDEKDCSYIRQFITKKIDLQNEITLYRDSVGEFGKADLKSLNLKIRTLEQLTTEILKYSLSIYQYIILHGNKLTDNKTIVSLDDICQFVNKYKDATNTLMNISTHVIPSVNI